MRQVILLVALAVSVSSCATRMNVHLPIAEPEGKLCTHKVLEAHRVTDTVVQIESEIECASFGEGIPLLPVDLEQTHDWILMDPDSFESLMNYVWDLEDRLN